MTYAYCDERGRGDLRSRAAARREGVSGSGIQQAGRSYGRRRLPDAGSPTGSTNVVGRASVDFGPAQFARHSRPRGPDFPPLPVPAGSPIASALDLPGRDSDRLAERRCVNRAIPARPARSRRRLRVIHLAIRYTHPARPTSRCPPAEAARRRGGEAANPACPLLNGKAGMSANMALALEDIGWGTAEHWMRMQASYDLAQARRERTSHETACGYEVRIMREHARSEQTSAA